MRARCATSTEEWRQDQIIQETKRELKRIEDRVGRVLTFFGNRIRADTGIGRLECERDQDSTYKQWYNWLRHAKQRNLYSAEGRTTTHKCSSRDGCGNQASMVERTAFPTFDSKQEKWPGFVGTFKEFIKASG